MSILEVFSPYDGTKLGEIERVTEEGLEQMLQRADAVFKDRSKWLSISARVEILRKLSAMLETVSEDYAQMIAKECGKPLTDSRIEVSRAINGIRLAIKELPHMKGEEVPMGQTPSSEGRRAYTFMEPIGVVAAVSAFNHPLNLIIHQVVPAIAVGAPVIIKPDSGTPLCAKRFVDMVYEAGLPKDWCQLCVCSQDITGKLTSDKRIAFLSFVGSARVGWLLVKNSYPGMRFALEHGGIAPAIVDKNIDDMDAVVASIAKGAFYHAGQVCISTQRVYVHSDVREEFCKKLIDKSNSLKVGDPLDAATEVGPLILPKELDRMDEWIAEAVSGGATVMCGGERISESLYKPTVLFNPPKDAKVSREEVFGPVVSIYEYSDIDNALELANDSEYPFQSAVYSTDINVINRLTEELDASAVLVNDHTAFRVDWMPFAGRRKAGFGIGGISHSMHDMTQYKMVVIKR